MSGNGNRLLEMALREWHSYANNVLAGWKTVMNTDSNKQFTSQISR